MRIMDQFKNMTIKRRFTASVLTVVIIFMFIFTVIRITMVTVTINNDISQEIETTARLTALSFVDPIWNLNGVGIKEISDALFQDKNIGYILVKAEGIGEIYKRYNTGEIYDNKNLLIKKVKVLKGDLIIGEVTVGITKYYRIKTLQNDIMTTIASALVMVLVLWSAIHFVSRIVTKSIYDLSLGTDEISKGNLTHRLTVDSMDEIGELARKFNSMTVNLYNMIKERDEAIKALGASEEKFNKAFNYCTDVIGIVRYEDKLYIEVNEAFLSTFGYQREEVIGHYSNEFNLWGDEEQHSKVNEVLDNGDLVTNVEAAWNTKDGKSRVGLISTEMIEISGVPCFIFVWNDITERKQADEALQKETFELEKLRTEFFANISHELRTPLNIILGTIQIAGNGIQDEAKPIDRSKLLKNINIQRQNCFRLLRLINNLIDSTKLDSGHFELNMINCNIVNIVEEIALSVAEYINDNNISLAFDTDIEEKIVACDPDKIERIMLNLLANAIKFTNEGGKIFVNIVDGKEYITISVEDTGIGIPEEKIGIIFDRFRQVDKSFTRSHEGSGIGLSLVKSFLEMQGATISIESKYGVGTKFMIKFPVKVLEENKEKANTADNYIQNSVEKIRIEFSDIYK